MKSFVAIIPILAFATMAFGHDSEYQSTMNWLKDKAMESCLGVENTKFWETEMKKQVAECAGEEAPELDLPFFNTSPYRVTSGLITGAYRNSNEFSDDLVKSYIFKKLTKSRFRRQAVEDETKPADDSEDNEVGLELGDKLIEKLQGYKEKMQAKIGNMTCVLRKSGFIDDKNELQLENLIAYMDKFPVPLNPWLKDHLVKDKKKCYAYVQALPEEILTDCVTGPELTKIKFFKKCMKMAKTYTCMQYDVRQNLETNFGSVEELVEKTGLEEKELYHLVSTIMNEHRFD